MLNIPFPKSSNLNFFHFAKITEQLRTYQVQRDILVDEQRSHDFSSSVCFLFAITDGMVKVLVGGCFELDSFDFAKLSVARPESDQVVVKWSAARPESDEVVS